MTAIRKLVICIPVAGAFGIPVFAISGTNNASGGYSLRWRMCSGLPGNRLKRLHESGKSRNQTVCGRFFTADSYDHGRYIPAGPAGIAISIRCRLRSTS